MGFYSQVILPRFYDCLMDQPIWTTYRQQQLARAEGQILEIGAGTGLNLPHYPNHVRRITTVDPNPGMNKMLEKRTKNCRVAVDQHVLSSELLPFEDACFDCVVSTLTLCSIKDVGRALGELHRVLKTGGRFLFLEHGLSHDVAVQKWQRRLNPWQKRFADGCRLDLNLRQVLGDLPFRTLQIDSFYLEKTPKTHGYLYRGVATK